MPAGRWSASSSARAAHGTLHYCVTTAAGDPPQAPQYTTADAIATDMSYQGIGRERCPRRSQRTAHAARSHHARRRWRLPVRRCVAPLRRRIDGRPNAPFLFAGDSSGFGGPAPRADEPEPFNPIGPASVLRYLEIVCAARARRRPPNGTGPGPDAHGAAQFMVMVGFATVASIKNFDNLPQAENEVRCVLSRWPLHCAALRVHGVA